MNLFNLLLLVTVLLIFIYILYYYFFSSFRLLNTKLLNLNSAVPPFTALESPSSARYAYGVWIFINNLGTTPGTTNQIIGRTGNFSLSVAADSPTLYSNIMTTGSSGGNQPTVITNNFPVQRWCFVLISVDGQFIDYYINGKLVRSEKKQSTNPIAIPSSDSTSSPIILGNPGGTPPFDAYLAKIIHWSSAVDPQTAWSTYLSGNGLVNTLMPYHANLNFVKNDVTTSTYQLW